MPGHPQGSIPHRLAETISDTSRPVGPMQLRAVSGSDGCFLGLDPSRHRI
jgi:hypothetical protein